MNKEDQEKKDKKEKEKIISQSTSKENKENLEEAKISSEKKEPVKTPKEKKKLATPPAPKKDEAVARGVGLPISTKHASAICRFIMGKSVEEAIADLEKVIKKEKAVPMRGEIPHRKGMMSGRYPEKASRYFIKLLKTLRANMAVNGLDELLPISLAVANIGQRPYGKFGTVRRKRTHVLLKVKLSPINKSRKKKR